MKNRIIHKILIANRAEIASRIIKAAENSGRKTIAIYADQDRDLPFVKAASESVPLGNGALSETYLNQELIIKIAKQYGADAIHPGYGFLSENSDFASMCEKNKIIFIGPGAKVIDTMGNKANARESAKKAGVPVIEGIRGTGTQIIEQAGVMDFPILIKPSAGGGGKGMKIVGSHHELKDAVKDAERESYNYFGSSELYVEKYIERARHIEVQILADQDGNVIHLFERECSLQRRYQKIIEEAPSPSLSEKTRKRITESAVTLAKKIGYLNAGTIEFLLDEEENFFFIEMNTRIQVEHPVTEAITKVDLVSEQIRIAEGKLLSFSQEDLTINGHAIESRIYAEDPWQSFIPSTGRILSLEEDSGLRADTGYKTGNVISPNYDPMISKVIAHGKDRKEAIEMMIDGLINYHLSGISSNRDFLLEILRSPAFQKNQIHTRYLDENINEITKLYQNNESKLNTFDLVILSAVASLAISPPKNGENNIWNETGHWRLLPSVKIELGNTEYRVKYHKEKDNSNLVFEVEGYSRSVDILEMKGNFYSLRLNNERYTFRADLNGADIWIDLKGRNFKLRRTDIPDPERSGIRSLNKSDSGVNEVVAPLNGKVVQINVKEKQEVKIGDTLLVIESMKMENKIASPRDAIISKININPGELVELNKPLITIK